MTALRCASTSSCESLKPLIIDGFFGQRGRHLHRPWRLGGAVFPPEGYPAPGLDLLGVLSLTPAPPPFSLMNSTPAASKARRIASSLAAVSDVGPSATSALRTVFAPREAAFARSAALHRSSARAARIWAAEITP